MFKLEDGEHKFTVDATPLVPGFLHHPHVQISKYNKDTTEKGETRTFNGMNVCTCVFLDVNICRLREKCPQTIYMKDDLIG